MTWIARLLLIALLSPLAASSLWGQNELVNIEGELVGIRGQLMQVKGNDAKVYLVLLPKDARQLKYRGTAAAGWLRPGIFVRFSGTFDDRGIGQEPILEMEAFTLEARRAPAEQQADTTPGIYPTEGGGALFGGAEGGKRKPTAVASYRVVGQVAGLGRKGELGVMIGPRQMVQVQLTEETKIKLDVQGIQFAMPGDKVVVDGYFNPPVETNITANSVSIEASDILGKVAAKPVRKTAKQRREEAVANKAAEKEAAEKPADDAAEE